MIELKSDLEKILSEVVATQAIENIIVTEDTKEILRDCIMSKKTFDQARKEAIEYFSNGKDKVKKIKSKDKVKR